MYVLFLVFVAFHHTGVLGLFLIQMLAAAKKNRYLQIGLLFDFSWIVLYFF